ncbi:hypothetical protein F5146DRAFT_1001634 [Armillaria mellea]|nr:hypothetical protein F5146DRAFT_1001634 [Armillaria mellea]
MSEPKKFWLLKVKPDSWLVKAKGVKFSVDDFETIGTSAWEGICNYEARNLIKEMKVGDKLPQVAEEVYLNYTCDPAMVIVFKSCKSTKLVGSQISVAGATCEKESGK